MRAVAWNGESDFRANLEADPEVMDRLTTADLDILFDYTYFTRHLGVVFDRLGI